MCKHTTLSPIYNIRIMRQTEFITLAMKELLIPSEGFCNLFPNGLEGLRKVDKSFFELQTFPHVGDIVAGLDGAFTLFKVRQITWARNNEIRVAQDASDKGYPLTQLYPICISNEMLIRLGFYWDQRFNKFRLRLKDFRKLDISKTSYSAVSYIEEIGYIEYLHELQAILRVYHIDQGIFNGQLSIKKSYSLIENKS